LALDSRKTFEVLKTSKVSASWFSIPSIIP